MAVFGMRALFKGIVDAFDERFIAVENIAVSTGQEALRLVRAQQFGAPHEPPTGLYTRGRRKGRPRGGRADTAAKKEAARQFARDNQDDTPKYNMGSPWTNRTFRAARGIYANVGSDNESVWVNLYHTMSYGVYLELANNRKHAIIEPIIRQLAPEFIARVKAVYGAS